MAIFPNALTRFLPLSSGNSSLRKRKKLGATRWENFCAAAHFTNDSFANNK
jgi:hypothetical protein